MKAYKLTDENGQTSYRTQWGPNVSHTATGCHPMLCNDGWIHFYTHPMIAVLMNPIHAAFTSPKLWECETAGRELHEPLKSGCKTLTTIREIPLPEITTKQKIVFAILCAKEVCNDPKWNKWADNWLNGEIMPKLDYCVQNAAAYCAYTMAYDPNKIYGCYAALYADSDASNPIDFIKLIEQSMIYT